MSMWSNTDEISNCWGNFKSQLFDKIQELYLNISANKSDISTKLSKESFGMMNAFKYNRNDIFDKDSDLYRYLSGDYRQTITREGRIFKYDSDNKCVVEIDVINKKIEKYSIVVADSSITYTDYIGTYVDDTIIYSYFWGHSKNVHGLFKVQHNDDEYAASVNSLYIKTYFSENIVKDYYINSPNYSSDVKFDYIDTILSVLIGNSVYIICGTKAIYSNYQYSFDAGYDIAFCWDGNETKKISVQNDASFFYTERTFTGKNHAARQYHKDRGQTILLDNNVTYSEGFKLNINETNLTISNTTSATELSHNTSSNKTRIGLFGLYKDYIVLANSVDKPKRLILTKISNSSEEDETYDIIPFNIGDTAEYRKLSFVCVSSQNGEKKNYIIRTEDSYADGLSETKGAIIHCLDE